MAWTGSLGLFFRFLMHLQFLFHITSNIYMVLFTILYSLQPWIRAPFSLHPDQLLQGFDFCVIIRLIAWGWNVMAVFVCGYQVSFPVSACHFYSILWKIPVYSLDPFLSRIICFVVMFHDLVLSLGIVELIFVDVWIDVWDL